MWNRFTRQDRYDRLATEMRHRCTSLFRRGSKVRGQYHIVEFEQAGIDRWLSFEHIEPGAAKRAVFEGCH